MIFEGIGDFKTRIQMKVRQFQMKSRNQNFPNILNAFKELNKGKKLAAKFMTYKSLGDTPAELPC